RGADHHGFILWSHSELSNQSVESVARCARFAGRWGERIVADEQPSHNTKAERVGFPHAPPLLIAQTGLSHHWAVSTVMAITTGAVMSRPLTSSISLIGSAFFGVTDR